MPAQLLCSIDAAALGAYLLGLHNVATSFEIWQFPTLNRIAAMIVCCFESHGITKFHQHEHSLQQIMLEMTSRSSPVVMQ
jgi:hypothetical protein